MLFLKTTHKKGYVSTNFTILWLTNNYTLLSKSFNLEDIVNKSPIDNNNTNIDNKALNLKLNSLPSPKLPDFNNPKNKHILEKLENILPFIQIKSIEMLQFNYIS